MALAYFRVDGTPRNLYAQPMDMRYFESALDFVASEVEGGEKGVGLYGISKGGEVALSMCAFFPQRIRAAVVVNTMNKVFGVPVRKKVPAAVKKIPAAIKYQC